MLKVGRYFLDFKHLETIWKSCFMFDTWTNVNINKGLIFEFQYDSKDFNMNDDQSLLYSIVRKIALFW